MIRLQFVLGAGLSSRAIAWFGAGHFSHVDCVLPDGSLLGARSDRAGHRPAGVEVRPANYEKWKKRVVFAFPGWISKSREQRFYDFLRDQIGKQYDSTAIWGFAAGRDWREEDKWFCSELQAAAGELIGLWPGLYSPKNKIMPGTLATVASAVGAISSEPYA